MALFSEAIEYYGANEDHEMCIDLNMRMQSILVRPYILDSLSEHNQVTDQESREMKYRLSASESGNIKTNFENDNRRSSNPFRHDEEQE